MVKTKQYTRKNRLANSTFGKPNLQANSSFAKRAISANVHSGANRAENQLKTLE